MAARGVLSSLLIVAVLGLLVLLAWGLLRPAQGAGSPGVNAAGSEAPIRTRPATDFRLQIFDPPPIGWRLLDHRGRPVVVNFWASWCAPCQAEQPAVNALAKQEAATGVRFVGISVDVDRSAADSYVSRFAVPYDSLLDTAQTMVVDYEVAGPPTTFVIDPGGRVSAELLGEVNTADLHARIATAIARH